MPQADDAIVVADAVTVRFGDVEALRRVSVRFAAGSAVALIGPNGSGKTTLLQVVAGLRSPDAGRLVLPRPERARMAYVAQAEAHRPWVPLTVREVLRMGRYRHRGLWRRLRTEDHDVVEAVAERLELTAMLSRQFGELSGGQRQRVRVAQALAQEPTVLLLDEPITGLDLASQQRILDLIDAEVQRGTTVVITTHDLDEARHCQQVVLLAGRVVADGPPGAVLTPQRLREAYAGRLLGEHGGHRHDAELWLLDDHGHHHDHLDLRYRPTVPR